MRYLMLVCAGEDRAPSQGAIDIEQWVQETDDSGARLLGRALDDPRQAVTVRVRDGETLLSDGPFAETKEFVAGFDVIECEDLDEAVEVAGRHPVAWFGAIEVRPFSAGFELPAAAREWAAQEPRDSYAMFMCADGIPASDEVEASLVRDGAAWAAELERRGVYAFGSSLAAPDAATTVRVIGGEVVLSDGPFVETKEFIAGVVVVHGVAREEAVRAAAGHPLAAHHRVEVRRFSDE